MTSASSESSRKSSTAGCPQRAPTARARALVVWLEPQLRAVRSKYSSAFAASRKPRSIER